MEVGENLKIASDYTFVLREKNVFNIFVYEFQET
jgi:hypothetical protein